MFLMFSRDKPTAAKKCRFYSIQNKHKHIIFKSVRNPEINKDFKFTLDHEFECFLIVCLDRGLEAHDFGLVKI